MFPDEAIAHICMPDHVHASWYFEDKWHNTFSQILLFYPSHWRSPRAERNSRICCFESDRIEEETLGTGYRARACQDSEVNAFVGMVSVVFIRANTILSYGYKVMMCVHV